MAKKLIIPKSRPTLSSSTIILGGSKYCEGRERERERERERGGGGGSDRIAPSSDARDTIRLCILSSVK